MCKNVKFWDWAQEMQALNIVLQGTNSHLTDTALYNQLEALLEPSLHSYYIFKKLSKVTNLKKWVQAIKEADEKLCDDHKCSHDIFIEEVVVHANKHPTLASHLHSTNTSSNPSPNTTSSLGGSSIKKCPKLEANK